MKSLLGIRLHAGRLSIGNHRGLKDFRKTFRRPSAEVQVLRGDPCFGKKGQHGLSIEGKLTL